MKSLTCSNCSCHVPARQKQLESQRSDHLTQIKSLQSQISSLQLQLADQKAQHNQLSREWQNQKVTIRKLELSSKALQTRFDRETAHSENIIQANVKLKKGVAASKTEVKQLTRNLEQIEQSQGEAHFANSKLANALEQIAEAKAEGERSQDAFRNYQRQQQAVIDRYKLKVKGRKQHHDLYLQDVNPTITSLSQITRLSRGVLRYMSDRNFSRDQMGMVVAKIAKEHFDGDTIQQEKSKWSRQRQENRLQDHFGELKEFIATVSHQRRLQLLPQNAVDEIRREGAEHFAAQLYCHWSVVLCANLKMSLKLSRRKWDLMKRILFGYKHPRLGWVRLWFDGVLVPVPCSHHKIEQWMSSVADDYDLEEINSGLTAVISLKAVLHQVLKSECEQNYFKWVHIQHQIAPRSVLNKGRPLVQICFDAAGTMKHRKTTAVSCKLANGSPYSHKPVHTHTVAISEGGDEQNDLITGLGSVFDDLNDLIANPVITTSTKYEEKIDVDVEVCAGADQKAVHANFGLCGCNRKFSCPLCHCPNTSFTNVHPPNTYTNRSLDNIRLLAHTIEGTCPGCKMIIVDKTRNLGPNETPLALPGQKPPKVPAQFASHDGPRRIVPTWTDLHFGVIYGSKVILQLPPSRFAICILHLNLRMVGNLLKLSMFRKLGPGQQKQAEELWKCLVASGIPIRQVKCTKNVHMTDWYQTISSHSFAGADAARMLLIYKDALEIVFPSDWLKSQPSELQAKVSSYYKVWSLYADLWADLNNLDITKEQKATVIEGKAAMFAETWRFAFGSTPTLYLHLLLDHVPTQLRELPIDLWYLQTEGLEHANKIRKQFAATMVNAHKAGSQRFVEVDSYVNRYGTTVDAHLKFSGPCLSYQLMKKTVVWDHLQMILVAPEHENRATQLEKHRERKVQAKKTFKADTERLVQKFLDS